MKLLISGRPEVDPDWLSLQFAQDSSVLHLLSLVSYWYQLLSLSKSVRVEMTNYTVIQMWKQVCLTEWSYPIPSSNAWFLQFPFQFLY